MKVLEFLKKLDDDQKILIVSFGWDESVPPDFEGKVRDFQIPAKFADTMYFEKHVASICADEDTVIIRYISGHFKPEITFKDDTVFNFLTISRTSGSVAVVHKGTDKLISPEWIGIPDEMPFEFGVLTKKVQRISSGQHGLVFEV